MKSVIVASKNPVKIKSTQIGFESMFIGDKFVFEGVGVGSDVSDQPMGDEETFKGAYNRAFKAREQFVTADFWVGIEGGNIEHNHSEMEAMAWIVVLDQTKMGKARTAGFFLPQKVIELIKQGYELGLADEIVFGLSNTKQKMGTTGLLTNNVIDRTQYYTQAVILALIPFLKPDLYE
jgi:inosine/xanthosine triphosphatase